MTLGLGLRYATELEERRERAAVMAALLFDKRWPRPFAKYHIHTRPETMAEPRKGKLPTENPIAFVAAALSDYGTDWVALSPRKPAYNSISVDAGSKKNVWPTRICPYRLTNIVDSTGLRDIPRAVAAWVTLAHDLARAVQARNGAITVHPEATIVIGDCGGLYLPAPNDHLDITGGGTTSYDGAENVGGKYSCYPRWGTYLHAGHVDAIGGRRRIEEVVQPALIEEVGDLLYIQLTATIWDAWTPEMWDKRLRFRRLMEPILVPG